MGKEDYKSLADFDECVCPCHWPQLSMVGEHNSPCCRQCPHCGRQIETASFTGHTNQCKDLEEKKEVVH